MENVPRIGKARVFTDFVAELQRLGYAVDWRSCNGPEYGLPQGRRRLVLLASLLGPLQVPDGPLRGQSPRTVRDTIAALPALTAGQSDTADPLHKARTLSDLNLRRLRASSPGGSWHDWPEELRAPCHRKASGSTFRNVYARMEWDKPSPTITTMAFNYGTGRFGHPEQDRAITLREAAMLQGFPREYRFVQDGRAVHFNHLGRLIGNAVPPPIAAAVGAAVIQHVTAHAGQDQAARR
jgi:DNA (cytosine-5)-methyltransferase 1